MLTHLAISAGLGVFLYVISCRYPLSGDIWIAAHVAELVLLAVQPYASSWSYALWQSSSFVTTQIIFFCITCALYRVSPWHPLASFPGPIMCKISSLPSVFRVARGKRFESIHLLHQHYGLHVRTGPNTLSINDHEAIATIYASSQAWDKSSAYQLGRFSGIGLFFIRDLHVHNFRRRHYWAPAFSASALMSHNTMLQERADAFVNALKQRSGNRQRSVDLSLALQHWSHDVTGQLTFGDAYELDFLRDGDPDGVVNSALLETQTFEALGESPALMDVLWHLPATNILRLMDLEADRSIERRRRVESSSDDLMRHLLNEDGKDVPQLKDTDLRQDAIVALAAGTNGISTALTFAFFYVLSDRRISERLVAELRAAFLDEEDGDPHLTTDRLATLPYLSAVTEESMRLGAPLGTFARVVPANGAMVAGRYVVGGTIVSVPAWAQNISEQNFSPNSEQFLPERWLPGGLGPNSHANRNAIMTFSHGPFGCLGRQLAYMEMRLILAKTLLQLELQLAPEFEHRRFLDGVHNMRVTTFSTPLQVRVM